MRLQADYLNPVVLGRFYSSQLPGGSIANSTRSVPVQIELNLQWNHLAAVTNRIDQARQDLSNRLEVARKLIKDTEVKQLKVIAATLTNTEPDVAVITLRMETNVVESAKYLYFMENAERAKILTELNQGTPEDQKLANDIIQEFKNIGQDIPINPTE